MFSSSISKIDSKQQSINDIYFDKSCFFPKSTTLKDAKTKDASTTMDDRYQQILPSEHRTKKPRGETVSLTCSSSTTFKINN